MENNVFVPYHELPYCDLVIDIDKFEKQLKEDKSFRELIINCVKLMKSLGCNPK